MKLFHDSPSPRQNTAVRAMASLNGASPKSPTIPSPLGFEDHLLGDVAQHHDTELDLWNRHNIDPFAPSCDDCARRLPSAFMLRAGCRSRRMGCLFF
jgi:hypothetical protein